MGIFTFQVAYAEECGLSPEEGSIFVMMLGACTAFGRIVFGKVVQYGYLNRLHMHQFSMVITGTGVMLLPLLKSFGGISAYVICVGLVDGCYVVLLPVLTATLVGVENTVLAWGFLVGASSITFTAGPPLAGIISVCITFLKMFEQHAVILAMHLNWYIELIYFVVFGHIAGHVINNYY